MANRSRVYFKRWIEALENALKRGGVSPSSARALAEDAVTGIQGALTLARALNDKAIFGRQLRQLADRLERALVD